MKQIKQINQINQINRKSKSRTRLRRSKKKPQSRKRHYGKIKGGKSKKLKKTLKRTHRGGSMFDSLKFDTSKYKQGKPMPKFPNIF